MASKFVKAFKGMARDHLRACIKQSLQCLAFGVKHSTPPREFLDPNTPGGNPVPHFNALMDWARSQLDKMVPKT